MKRRKLVYLLFILCTFKGFGQVGNFDPVQLNNSNTFNVKDLRSKDVVGSSYIHDEFLPAKVSNNGKLYFVRFDAYRNLMEAKRGDQILFFPKIYNSPIVFEKSNKTYQVFEFDMNNERATGFFVVLERSEKMTLLLQEKIEYYDAVKPKSGYTEYKPPKLERVKDLLFISLDGKTAIEIPRKKKEFFNLFTSKSEEIESFAKANKLNFKDLDELTKILEYYSDFPK